MMHEDVLNALEKELVLRHVVEMRLKDCVNQHEAKQEGDLPP